MLCSCEAGFDEQLDRSGMAPIDTKTEPSAKSGFHLVVKETALQKTVRIDRQIRLP